MHDKKNLMAVFTKELAPFAYVDKNNGLVESIYASALLGPYK